MAGATHCAWDGPSSSPVKEYIMPRPAPGTMRVLSPTPPPLQHPRVLFQAQDRADLLARALGEDSVAGKEAFRTVQDHVNSVVYGPLDSSPVRRLLEILACGESAPGGPGPRSSSSQRSPREVYQQVMDLVQDDGGAKVFRGAFYTQLFEKNLGPLPLKQAMPNIGASHMVADGAEDTTPELGAKLLFATLEGGLPETRSPVYVAAKQAAYVAWILGEEDRLKWLSSVLAMATRVQLLWYAMTEGDSLAKHNGEPAGLNREDDSVCQHLALAYDLLYNSMSESQRLGPRRLLLSMGRRRVLTGFNSQWYNRNGPGLQHTNTSGTFGVMTSVSLLVQCAVEGESVPGECDEGGKEYPPLQHDQEAQDLNCQGVKFWLTHGTAWDPTGTSRECPGYFGTAMRFASLPALAADRRGFEVFTASNFYAVLSEIVQTTVRCFDTALCFGGHDGIGFCGGKGQSEYFLIVKYMFPDDPVVDYVYQRINTDRKGHVGLSGLDRMPFETLLFGMNVAKDVITPGAIASAKGLPLAFFSNARGMGTARSDWADDNCAMLYFECRPDMYNLSHGHSNRNDFYFASHGRVWISVGQFHNTEPEAHAGVLIDGVGQGGSHTSKAPAAFAKMWSHIPGKVVATFDSPKLTSFTGDATVAYTYVSDGPQTPSDKASTKLPVQTAHSWKDFFFSPPDFGPSLCKDKATGKPKWEVDHTWADYKVLAAGEFNPVQYATRTACLVRSKKAYSVILDNIKKTDGAEHSFTWVANTTIPYSNLGLCKPACLLPPEQFGLDPQTEAVLARGEDVKDGKAGTGSPLLLVRVLRSAGSPAGPIRLVHVEKGFPANLDCASAWAYERLEIERVGCTDPGFIVLLFPFLEGEQLPATELDCTGSKMTVGYGDCKDVLAVQQLGNGTVLTMS